MNTRLRTLALAIITIITALSANAGENGECHGLSINGWYSEDLSEANDLEAAGRYREADAHYRRVADPVFARMLSSVRRRLRHSNPEWTFPSADDAFRSFREALLGGDLSTVLPPLLIGNAMGTDMLIAMTAECWGETLQQVASTTTTSDLIRGEHSYCFTVEHYGNAGGESEADRWYSAFPTIVFHIMRIEDSVFSRATGRYIVTSARLSRDDGQAALRVALEWEPTRIPATVRNLIGVREQPSEME
ncbi:MAG: hypothetical protein ACOC1U_01360 [Spirochaetota bacterium]